MEARTTTDDRSETERTATDQGSTVSMTDSAQDNAVPGVYSADANDVLRLVHHYQGGDYGLEDIVEYFRLGELDTASGDAVVVKLTAKELHQLKVLADAHSFDFEAPFIEMCLELERFGVAVPRERYSFLANF